VKTQERRGTEPSQETAYHREPAVKVTDSGHATPK
jgi:hypothetical protein